MYYGVYMYQNGGMGWDGMGFWGIPWMGGWVYIFLRIEMAFNFLA